MNDILDLISLKSVEVSEGLRFSFMLKVNSRMHLFSVRYESGRNKSAPQFRVGMLQWNFKRGPLCCSDMTHLPVCPPSVPLSAFSPQLRLAAQVEADCSLLRGVGIVCLETRCQ